MFIVKEIVHQLACFCHAFKVRSSKNETRAVYCNLLKSHNLQSRAFSLVEMLMALLVASLLLAALAPVMTKRMADGEIKILNEMSNYNKDSIITIFTDSLETQEFNIPTDANKITLTMMGGGGSGGDALYGNKEFTTSQNFTVPENVKKLRVFMVGGGGGGASGGMGNGVSYTSVPAIGNTYATITTAGSYTFADVVAPDTHIAPALHSYCKEYGTMGKWIVASDTETQVSPGAKIPKVDAQSLVTLSKITACGAGGGGGGNGGGGGSGGYIADKSLSSTVTASNLSIKIGEGGKSGYINISARGGAGGGTGGAKGGSCNNSSVAGGDGINGNGGNSSGWGGGGGGGTAISVISSSTMIAQIGGGGGGGGHVWRSASTWASTGLTGSRSGDSGAGGGGGGYGAGGGGGNASLVSYDTLGCNAQNGTNGSSDGTCGKSGFEIISGRAYPGVAGGDGYGGGGGGGAGAYVDNKYAEGATCGVTVSSGNSNSGSGGGGGGWIQRSYPNEPYSYGGGGGGGAGGTGGSGGGSGGGAAGKLASSIFNSANNCSGGSGLSQSGVPLDENNGKPGAMRIWYSAAAVANGLKCTFFRPSNGGGGGGAGQVWMGEIDVKPGQTITLNIGQGGAVQTAGAKNGNDGTATSIVVNGNIYSVSGGKGGKFESDGTYIANSGGLGGGIKTTNYSSSAVYKDWLKLGDKNTTNLTGGNNGEQGYLKDNSRDGAGGEGGRIMKIDGDYGAGGIGGESGGNGANAITINYGAGGGGGAGNIDGNFGTGGKGANGYIYIEWGGTNGGGGTNGEFIQKVITNIDGTDRKMLINIGKGGADGNGGDTTVTVKSGGKNIFFTARGGLQGSVGTSDAEVHGGETAYPSDYDSLYKEFVQSNLNIVSGQKGINEYGGMGGYISCIAKTRDGEGNSACSAIVKSNDGVDNSAGPVRPGCGGTSITAPLYESICLPYSTNANPNGGNGTFGGGGGGGAVLNQTGGKGGNGGNGFVILEYKSVQ